MNSEDKNQFKEMLDGLSEYYRQDKLSLIAIRIYFDSLTNYDFSQVSEGITRHVQDPKAGQFFPKVGDIIRHVEGGGVTHDQIVSSARLKNSPFGILCRIQIGTWDLEHQTDMFYLKQRAEECLQKLPEWKIKAATGDFSDHEVMIMLKYDIDPSGPFIQGLPKPDPNPKMMERIRHLRTTDRYKFLTKPEETFEDGPVHEDVAKFLSELPD